MKRQRRQRDWVWSNKAQWLAVVVFTIIFWCALFWAFETFLPPFWWR